MGSARRPEFTPPTLTQARSAVRYGGFGVTVPTAPGGTPIVWFDASNINLLNNVGIADGDPVGTWKNAASSGATYDPTATSFTRPTYRVARIGGKSAVVYNTVNNLHCTTGNPFVANSARHMWFVLTVPATTQGVWFCNEGVGYAVYVGNSSVKFEDNLGGTANRIAAAPATGLDAIYEVTFDGVTTNRPTCRINGVDQVVTQQSGTGVGTETNTNTFYLAYQYNQQIAEVIGYTAVQSAAVVAENRAYLTGKYGIAA